MKRLQPLTPHLIVLLLYLLAAMLITWPLILNPAGQFIGSDTSDAYEMARHIWWFKTAIQNGLDPFWQSNLGYPDGFSGVSLQANTLQFFPAWFFAFFLPLPLAYNGTILLTMALNGWALWLLARDRLPDAPPAAALLGGLVFMAFPVFQGHLADGHAGLMVMWPVPLYTLALFRLVEAERWPWGWFIAAVIFFQLAPSGHMLQVFYVLLPLTGLFLLARMWRRDWRGVLRIIAMGVVSSVLLLIFLLPVIVETLNTPVYEATQGYVRYSTDLLGLVSPSFLHPVFGAVLDYPRRVLGVNLTEGATYIGLVVLILSMIALRRQAARWWLLLAGLTALLALGPLLKLFDQPLQIRIDDYNTYIPLPWALVQNLPGFNLARTPGRFSFTLALAVGMLAAYGAAVLWAWLIRRGWRSPLRNGLALLLAGLILFEYQTFWPIPTRPADVPQAITDLRNDENVRAVFNVPWGHLLAAKDALYLQTEHHLPLIAGQATRTTPVNPAKLDLLEQTLNPSLLREVGADIVIMHRQRAAEIDQLETLEARLQAQIGEPYYRDERLALYRVPDGGELPVTLTEAVTDISTGDIYTASAYSAEPGWLSLDLTLEADPGRVVSLRWNNAELQRWTLDGQQREQMALPISEAAFYRLELVLEPPCPPRYDDSALACRSLTIEDIQFGDLLAASADAPLNYAGGISLISWSEPEISADTLQIHLLWDFNEAHPDTRIRFVHVLDENGAQVYGDDRSLGTFAAGTQRIDTVSIPLNELPAGSYSLRTGWYTYPELTRLGVLDSDLPGAQDAAPEIGQFSTGATP